MKKKVWGQILLGFPLGIALGYVITILFSIISATGSYLPCVPQLEERMGSQLSAVILQTVLCGLLGSAFSAISIIWQLDHWSISRQTGIYFLLASCIILPIAYFANWMEHTLMGFVCYFGVFCVIFILIWLIRYWLWKKSIKKINKKIE